MPIEDFLVDFYSKNTDQEIDQVNLRGQIVEIEGLDANWDVVTQFTLLNGTDTTTSVILSTPLIRVYRMKLNANFKGLSNITLHNTGNTITYAQITPTNNQTLMAIYTVPRGYTAFMTVFRASVINSTNKTPKSTEIKLWAADRLKDRKSVV